MSIVFSLLHATYGRPQKAVAAMRMALERAARPESVEYIFAGNEDDRTWVTLLANIGEAYAQGFAMPRFVNEQFAGSAPAWDAAAKASTGQILLQMSDDLELPQNFDALLEEECVFNAGPKWNDRPSYIAVSDGFRKDSLCTCAVMNRKYYELAGHFIPPEYWSVFSDNEVTYRAMKRSVGGDAVFIDARSVTLLHRHHYHDKSVPWDKVYARGNSEEAYRLGAELFAQRNPEAATDGLVTWR